ncbi:MAG TPA: DUF359 domain-containing protein [Thermoplasmata archaeon]|nr:DUF359 domain-containing protein [Thermoplasmata archaeon]
MRSRLAGVHGRLVRVEEIDGSRMLVSVGDYCSQVLLDAGLRPQIVVIDMATKRGPYKFRVPAGYLVVKVENPAGYLTEGMRRALEDAVLKAKSGERTLIHVVGEEDLAVPPLLPLLERGSQVIYGVPDSGMAMLVVDDALKGRALEILEAMVEEDE